MSLFTHVLMLGTCALMAGCSPPEPATNSAVAGEGRDGDGNRSADTPADTALLTADWPTFRGDAHQTGVAAGALPGRLSLLWTRDVAESISAPAIIVGDRIYLGADGVEDKRLLALRLKDGTQVWEYALNGMVEAAPGYRDGRVFIGDKKGFHAVDAGTGQKIWSHETDGQISSSANFHGKSVLVGSYDCNLYGFDAATGEMDWAFENVAQIHCSPCIAGDIAGISGCDGSLHLIDTADGTEINAVPLGAYVIASAGYRDGLYFAATHTGEMVAAREDDVDPVWSVVDEGGQAQFYASPAVAVDRIVFIGQDGVARCVSREDGAILWTFDTGSSVKSSPVVAGDRVYFGDKDGMLYGLALKDGSTVWEFEAGGSFVASPAVGRGVLVIGNEDGALYCFGASAEGSGR